MSAMRYLGVVIEKLVAPDDDVQRGNRHRDNRRVARLERREWKSSR